MATTMATESLSDMAKQIAAEISSLTKVKKLENIAVRSASVGQARPLWSAT